MVYFPGFVKSQSFTSFLRLSLSPNFLSYYPAHFNSLCGKFIHPQGRHCRAVTSEAARYRLTAPSRVNWQGTGQEDLAARARPGSP
jgi:hypothetical protein